MPAPEFYSGDMAHVFVTINTIVMELPARGWNLSIDGKIKDVSNARDGRYRIGGLIDASGSIDMPLDGAIYLPRPKDIATAKLYTDYVGLKFFALTIIFSMGSPGVNLEGEAVYSTPFLLQSGTVTYPIYP